MTTRELLTSKLEGDTGVQVESLVGISNSQGVVLCHKVGFPILDEVLFRLRNGDMSISDSTANESMLEVKFRNIELVDLFVDVRKVKHLQVINSVLADGQSNAFRGVIVLDLISDLQVRNL